MGVLSLWKGKTMSAIRKRMRIEKEMDSGFIAR